MSNVGFEVAQLSKLIVHLLTNAINLHFYIKLIITNMNKISYVKHDINTHYVH